MERTLKRLSDDLNSGRCSGIGETAINHFNKNGEQRVLQFPPNYEPFLRIVDLIAGKGAWIDMHAAPVNPEGKSHERQLFRGYELLYGRNPHLKLILSHTGMTNPMNAQSNLRRYHNMMMNINIHNKHHRWRKLEPLVNPQGEMYEDWAQLFEEMPDRFMVGAGKSPKTTGIAKHKRQIKKIRRILGTIEPRIARMIAYDNAVERFR